MNTGFLIPISPTEYNLFAIDDYLRSIRTSEERQKLMKGVGYSAQRRESYEARLGLPRGAVELAMMAEDQRVKELSDKLTQRMADGMIQQMSPQEGRNFYLEVDSIMCGLKALYPEAIQFLKQYGVMAQRNKASFRGDYQFGNDYRIMMAATCPGPPPPDPCNPTSWWCTEVYVYTWSLAVWAVFGAVLLSVLLLAFVLLVLCVTPPLQVPC